MGFLGDFQQNGFLVVGHRGAAGLAPENTLKSFRRAFDLGVDAIELDVHTVASGLAVIHDAEVDRTTNGRGAVSEFSLAELQALDAGDGEHVPMLDEVLAILPGGIGLNIELKGDGSATLLAETLHAPVENVLVSSFDHVQLAIFHESRPDVPCAPLFSKPRRDMISVARSLDAWSVNISDRIADRRRIEDLRALGFGVLVYTINDVARARELARCGATGVFTDFPDRVTRERVCM